MKYLLLPPAYLNTGFFSSLIHSLEGRWSGKNAKKFDNGGYFYKRTKHTLWENTRVLWKQRKEINTDTNK